MDPNTREELCIHLYDAANMHKEMAKTCQEQADVASVTEWKEEYKLDAIAHQQIAAALKDIAERISAGA